MVGISSWHMPPRIQERELRLSRLHNGWDFGSSLWGFSLLCHYSCCLLTFTSSQPSLAEKAMAPTLVLLPGKSMDGGVWWAADIFCGEISPLLGEGNGTPLQYSCLENPMDGGAWWAAVHGVAKSQTRLSHFTFTFHFQALEKEMATHSSVLAWRIPGTGEPGRLPSMGSHRVRHD